MHHSSVWRAGQTSGPVKRIYAAAPAAQVVSQPVPLRLEFGEFVRTHRESAGLTQVQLATAIGVSRATIGRWEGGISVPDGREGMESVGRLCDALDAPLAAAYRALGQPPPARASASIVERLGEPLVMDLIKFFENDTISEATKSRIRNVIRESLGLAAPDLPRQRRRSA